MALEQVRTLGRADHIQLRRLFNARSHDAPFGGLAGVHIGGRLCLVRSFGLLRGPEGWGEAAMLGAEARARFTSQRYRSRENRQNGGTG